MAESVGKAVKFDFLRFTGIYGQRFPQAEGITADDDSGGGDFQRPKPRMTHCTFRLLCMFKNAFLTTHVGYTAHRKGSGARIRAVGSTHS